MKKAMVGLAVVMIFASCQGKTNSSTSSGGSSSSSGSQPQKIKIAFARSESNDTWLSYLHDAFAAEFASKPEYEIIWSDGQNDVTRQQDNVNTAIAQGVKAVVVVPVDTSASPPMTRAAQEAGIPIIYVNRNPFGTSAPPQGAYYCGSDSVIAGRLQMEELGRQMGGTGGVCILMGQLNHEAAQDRSRGVKEVLQEKYPNIALLGEQSGNWMRNEAVTVVENWLTAYPNLTAIASNNDEMALGALVALESAGRKGVLVAGTDGNPDALQAVKDGRLIATVLQDAAGQGKGAADYAVRAIKGEKLEPVNWVPFVLITKENLSDYLK
ncbi:MAG: substrate-binding domain-containing protein [Spirochaetaceae bacterium]|jgi:inositol transport system substrate-binding protein|nr:substrate-binding domain-containing protein [Spirochaetaceae bacterium]